MNCVGIDFGRFMGLCDDWRRGFNSPTNGAKKCFQVGCAEFDSEIVERGLRFLAEEVVILEEIFAELAS